MMWRTRFLILYTLIASSIPVSYELPAQDLAGTISWADSQFSTGNLTVAQKAYLRALFFSDGKDNLYLFTQIARISYLNGDYESAQKYFGLAYDQTENDSLRTELIFYKASSQILNHNYQYAIMDLFSIRDSSLSVKKRVDFYLGTCYFGLEDFENSGKYFESCTSGLRREEVKQLFSEKKLFTPSPRKAKIMSMIIPGLGQTYAGDVKAGLNSLMLTSGLVALGINISLKYRPIDAFFSVLPWYQRYYLGGFGKAEEIAFKKRQQNRDAIYQKVLALIAEEVGG